MENKVITFEKVKERLEGVKPEDMTERDVIDRYIAYGNAEDFEDVEVQKVMLKYGYVKQLIYSVETIITDKAVIEGIISNDLFEDKSFMLKNGTIESMEIVEEDGESCLIINFIDKNKIDKYKIKYLYCQKKQQKYYNELIHNIGNELKAIVERNQYDKDLQLCCFLKTEKLKNE